MKTPEKLLSLKTKVFLRSEKNSFDSCSNFFKSSPVSNFKLIETLPHCPIEMFKDRILYGIIFLPNPSEQKVAATFASLSPENL